MAQKRLEHTIYQHRARTSLELKSSSKFLYWFGKKPCEENCNAKMLSVLPPAGQTVMENRWIG